MVCGTPAQALTTLNVTVDTDNNPGGTGDVGELRYWINTMNQQLASAADDYQIIFDHPMTIQLNGILPLINNSPNPVNITIGNSGSIATVTIDGNSGAYPGFFIPMGNVTIQNIVFQNLTARGGNGGDGISGGGGGLGAGAAIFLPESFLFGSNPSVTLMNVSVSNCSAVGGNGGNSLGGTPTGYEGGGGGGGLAGDGGSITIAGTTGGGGGGGYGGNGGNVTLDTSDPSGGGGGGGGGLGSRATAGALTNLGHGGDDNATGLDGNGLGLTITAGSGGGGLAGGTNAGGGGGGSPPGMGSAGGGGGGSNGSDGYQPSGNVPAFFARTRSGGTTPSGGYGGDGAGGGGAAVVVTSPTNNVDGEAGQGGYAGGGGGGAGIGATDTDYTVVGGRGGVGGGGGGGGINHSGSTTATGGGSLGGGGGGGGGASQGTSAQGGTDEGYLGGGAGGAGASDHGLGFGGGGGGGGSALGGAIFVDRNLTLTIQALSGVPTVVNTNNNTVVAGSGGNGGSGANNGMSGSALGNSIFLRSGATLKFAAWDADDLLTLGSEVAFVDDTSFGAGSTYVEVRGNGTVIYQGSSNYEGLLRVYNANFEVNGTIGPASVLVDRDIGFSAQKGMLSGSGTLSGDVHVYAQGQLAPTDLNTGNLLLDAGATLTAQASPSSVSHIAVTGTATLAGTLQVTQNSGTYASPTELEILSTTGGISGDFDNVSVTTLSGYTYSLHKTATTLSIVFEAEETAAAPMLADLGFAGCALVHRPPNRNNAWMVVAIFTIWLGATLYAGRKKCI